MALAVLEMPLVSAVRVLFHACARTPRATRAIKEFAHVPVTRGVVVWAPSIDSDIEGVHDSKRESGEQGETLS